MGHMMYNFDFIIMLYYSNFRSRKTDSPGGTTPREIDSPGYNTPGSHVLAVFLLTRWVWWRLTRRGRYDTPGRLTHQGIIPRGDWKIQITGQTLKQIENILTRWPVAQLGSNYNIKKTGGRKSRWTVPLSNKLLTTQGNLPGSSWPWPRPPLPTCSSTSTLGTPQSSTTAW